MHTDSIHEKALAEVLNVDRDILKKLRGGGVLEKGADWQDVRGEGIKISAAGRNKIEAALAVKASPVPEPVEVRDIVIRRFCVNVNVVEGEPWEGQPRVLVRLCRGPSKNYSKGMTLPACRRLPFAEQWEYPGPKPRFYGRF